MDLLAAGKIRGRKIAGLSLTAVIFNTNLFKKRHISFFSKSSISLSIIRIFLIVISIFNIDVSIISQSYIEISLIQK